MSQEKQTDWELLAQVSHTYRLLTEVHMHRVNIHRAQALLLYQVSKREGQTQSELAEQLALHGATITAMLRRLEASSLVIRLRDPHDNRQIRVYLTEHGRKMEHCIEQQYERLDDVIFEGIDQEDRISLRRLLNQILHNMKIDC